MKYREYEQTNTKVEGSAVNVAIWCSALPDRMQWLWIDLLQDPWLASFTVCGISSSVGSCVHHHSLYNIRQIDMSKMLFFWPLCRLTVESTPKITRTCFLCVTLLQWFLERTDFAVTRTPNFAIVRSLLSVPGERQLQNALSDINALWKFVVMCAAAIARKPLSMRAYAAGGERLFPVDWYCYDWILSMMSSTLCGLILKSFNFALLRVWPSYFRHVLIFLLRVDNGSWTQNLFRHRSVVGTEWFSSSSVCLR